MSVRWGLTEETICGLMSAAPWPLSARAFNASVRAGLLSSKTLAKADFFTGKLYLRSFGRSDCVCVCVCVYVCVCCVALRCWAFGSQHAAAHFLLNCSQYIGNCAGTQKNTRRPPPHTHTHRKYASMQACKQGSLYSLSRAYTCTHTSTYLQIPPTLQVNEKQYAKTSRDGPSATCNCVCVRDRERCI